MTETTRTPAPALPPVVSEEEWATARADLLTAEKELTHALDALAARRRRMPMVKVEKSYTFTSPDGPVTLLELFGDKHQLAVYQFMNNGPDNFCPGCTNFTNQVVFLKGLADQGVAWRTISDMPLEQMTGYWQEKGWTVPYASSAGTTFAADCVGHGGFQLTMFLRDGEDVYRTYTTGSRGVDRIMFEQNILDLAPYGRQEGWEDSPEGWPKGE
ncbi:DUF899 family protein [Luteipulveratus mongoliensis]|uniref:Thioredoxin domain-containing protein n=1 Tax=Luteipulveratus mongoliensis TaxID=571913 RepID=A0A0K1JFM3_9MICO|nr:DUF899 family protein [Luteipulveratus mongoliensis]AKU15383.1 hypothetical protein VV02_05070 [Luteipulveratus mongoliensis]